LTEPISLEAKRAAPVPEVIEALEELLVAARAGDMRSLVYLTFEGDGVWKSGNVGVLQNRQFVLGCFAQAALDYYSRRREDDQGRGL